MKNSVPGIIVHWVNHEFDSVGGEGLDGAAILFVGIHPPFLLDLFDLCYTFLEIVIEMH